jgi:hypothetical protein
MPRLDHTGQSQMTVLSVQVLDLMSPEVLTVCHDLLQKDSSCCEEDLRLILGHSPLAHMIANLT